MRVQSRPVAENILKGRLLTVYLYLLCSLYSLTTTNLCQCNGNVPPAENSDEIPRVRNLGYCRCTLRGLHCATASVCYYPNNMLMLSLYAMNRPPPKDRDHSGPCAFRARLLNHETVLCGDGTHVPPAISPDFGPLIRRKKK